MLENLPVLISEEEVQAKIAEVAAQIDKDYAGEDVVVISILKGAVFFTVDLVKKMKTPIELEMVQISSYQGTESTGKINFKKDLDGSIEGRDVLIVEDIIDTGRTLKYLKEYLENKKANSVKICTLLNKPERREVEVNVDYIGFDIPNKFVLGYGLDYEGYYRNLPYIGYIGD